MGSKVKQELNLTNPKYGETIVKFLKILLMAIRKCLKKVYLQHPRFKKMKENFKAHLSNC